MEELNEEQLEIKRANEEKEIIRHAIQAGKDLEQLRKSPAFKRLFLGIFLDMGKDILWQNIQRLTEEQMKGRGNDKNLEIIELIKGQVKSRLDFEGFMDTVEADYENALIELEEQEAESKED